MTTPYIKRISQDYFASEIVRLAEEDLIKNSEEESASITKLRIKHRKQEENFKAKQKIELRELSASYRKKRREIVELRDKSLREVGAKKKKVSNGYASRETAKNSEETYKKYSYLIPLSNLERGVEIHKIRQDNPEILLTQLSVSLGFSKVWASNCLNVAKTAGRISY